MKRALLGLVLGVLALVALVWLLNLRGEDSIHDLPAPGPVADQVTRGAYLARVGNCMGCHTERGGAAYAGGRAIETPFGAVYSSNLTPDAATGLGAWSADHFWRALHNGRSRDGRLLYPAFPYPNYTKVRREDSDALYAYLRSLPAVAQANRPHGLRWPFNTQAALAVWRALYFTPGPYVDDPRQQAEWNRGAYLVEGLGHCAACHSQRNVMGASTNMLDLSGGLIPMQNWYAPALTSPAEAGVSGWPQDQVVQLLHTGVTANASALGPMAEVVLNSTQYWSPQDLQAMAVFLKALPQVAPESPGPAPRIGSAVAERGAKIYSEHCIHCHGEQGRGVPGAYPPLAGNRAVLMPQTANLVQMVLYGGFAPATTGNPRPFGMPPYVLTLGDADVAAVLTHIRSSWGNAAPLVSEFDVGRHRSSGSR